MNKKKEFESALQRVNYYFTNRRKKVNWESPCEWEKNRFARAIVTKEKNWTRLLIAVHAAIVTFLAAILLARFQPEPIEIGSWYLTEICFYIFVISSLWGIWCWFREMMGEEKLRHNMDWKALRDDTEEFRRQFGVSVISPHASRVAELKLRKLGCKADSNDYGGYHHNILKLRYDLAQKLFKVPSYKKLFEK